MLLNIWFLYVLTDGCLENREADRQQKHSEPQIHSSSPATALAHPGVSTPNVQYAATPPLGAGHAMVLSSEQNLVKNCCACVYLKARLKCSLLTGCI